MSLFIIYRYHEGIRSWASSSIVAMCTTLRFRYPDFDIGILDRVPETLLVALAVL
jgi:hypothetical protein